MIASNLRQKFSELWANNSEDNWIPGRLGNQPAGGTIDVNGYPNVVYVRLGYTGEQGGATAYDAVGAKKEANLFIRMRRENGNLVIREAAAYASGSGPSGATNLDGLTDVTITSPSNGQTLQFSSGQWRNVAPPSGGAGGAPVPHGLATSLGYHTGQLPWSDLNKTGSSLANLSVRNHSDLTGITSDQHHKRSHDIITGDGNPGAVHTVVGSQYSLVGLPANNSLGLLTTSSNPGSTQQVLRTDATGALNLGGGLFNVLPGSQKINIDGTNLVIDGAANTYVSALSSTFNASTTFNSNSTFNNGVLRFNTDPQVNADIDFIGGDRNITATGSLHIQPKVDLYLESRPTGYVDPIFPNPPSSPVPRGNVVFPDDQAIRTPTFSTSAIGTDGWTIQWLGGFKHQLNISNISVDNLFAKKFTADEIRVQRGEWFLTRSFGIVQQEFFIVPAVNATVDVWFEEAPGLGAAKLFLANNWIEFRTIDWSTGLVIQTVFFTVVDADGSGTADYIQRLPASGDVPSRQQWRLKRMSGGFTGAKIYKGEVGADIGLPTTAMPPGQMGQGILYASSLYEPDFGPFLQVQLFDSVAGAAPHFLNKVRMGNLQSTVGFTVPTWGFAAGNDLSILPSSGNFSGVVIDAIGGLRMYNTDIHLLQGTTESTTIDRVHGISLLNDDTMHGHNLRMIGWYDSLDDIDHATATSKMSTWGPIDDRRFTASTYGRTLASVHLEANGNSGVKTANVSVWSGGSGEYSNGVFLIGAQTTVIGSQSDIGLPGSRVGIGFDSHSYPQSNLHVTTNEAAHGQTVGITMESRISDSVFHWYFTGGRVFTAGIDHDDGQKWKLSSGWNLGDGDFIIVDPATGKVTINGFTPGLSAPPTGLTASNGVKFVGSDIQTDNTVVRTSVSVTGGNGLSGGGPLSSSQTLSLNVGTTGGLEIVGGVAQIKDTLAGNGLIMTTGKVMTIDPAKVLATTARVNTALGTGLTGGDLVSNSPDLSILLNPTEPGLSLVGGLAVDGSVVRVTTAINTATGSGLTGGGTLNGSLNLSVLLASATPGLSLVGGLHVDGSVVRDTESITTTLPITGGATFGAGVTLGLKLATPSGLELDVSGGLRLADTVAGTGLKWTGRVLSIDTTETVPTTIQIISGAGLTGGGDLTGNRTLNVVALAGSGLQVNADDIQILLATASGLDTSSGLAISSSLAGNGLSFAPGILSVTVGPGLSIVTDAVQINLATNSGLNTSAGLGINTAFAGQGLLITSGVMDILYGSGLTIASDILDVRLGTNSGLDITSGLIILPSVAGAGLLMTAGVIDVKNADGTLIITTDDVKINQGFAYNWTGNNSWAGTSTFASDVTLNAPGAFTVHQAMTTDKNVTFNAGGSFVVHQPLSSDASVTLNAPGAFLVHQTTTIDGNVTFNSVAGSSFALHQAMTSDKDVTFATGGAFTVHQVMTADNNVNLNGPGQLAVGQQSNFTAPIAFNAKANINVTPDFNADLNFVGNHAITSNADLAISPGGLLTLSPGGNLISIPAATNIRSVGFSDTVGGIVGYNLSSSQLTISSVKTDNLISTAFTTNLVRLEQGDSYWGKGFGFVSGGFTLPAIDGTVDVWLDNNSNLDGTSNPGGGTVGTTGQIFSVGDKLQCRIINWTIGISLKIVWFKVESYLGENTSTFQQQWRLRRIAGGATGDTIPAGSILEDAGGDLQGWIHVTSSKGSGGPYMEFGQQNPYTFTSPTWGAPDFTQYVRIGQLAGTVDYAAGTNFWGFAAAGNTGLNVAPSAGFSGLTADATYGMRMFNTNVQLYNSANLVISMDKTYGLSFQQGFNEFNSITWYSSLGSSTVLSPQNQLANVGTHPDTTPFQELDLYAWGNPTSTFTQGAVRLRAFQGQYHPTPYTGSDKSYNVFVDFQSVSFYSAGGDPGGSVKGDSGGRITDSQVYFIPPLAVGIRAKTHVNARLEVRGSGTSIFRLGGSDIVTGPRIDFIQDSGLGTTVESYNDTSLAYLPINVRSSIITFQAGTVIKAKMSSSGFWGFGNTIDLADAISELEVTTSLASAIRGFASTQITTDGNAAMIATYKAQGTRAAKTAVVNGNNLGEFSAHGWDGTNWIKAAGMYMVVSGAVSAGVVPANLSLRTGGTDRLIVDSAGRIGVGAVPATTGGMKVDIRGSGSFTNVRLGYNSGNSYRTDWSINSTGAGLLAYDDVAAQYIPFSLSGSTLNFLTGNPLTSSLLINAAGLIGVNTLTNAGVPEFQLDVQGSVDGDFIALRLGNAFFDGASNDDSVSLRFDFGIPGSLLRTGAFIRATKINTYGSSGVRQAKLGFFIQNGSAGSVEAMTLLPSGNVGIGTSGPITLLHVGAGSAGQTNVYAGIYINAGPSSSLTLSNDTSIQGGMFSHSNGNFYMGGWGSHPLKIRVNNTDVLHFDTGLNIGVRQTATSPWHANYTGIEFFNGAIMGPAIAGTQGIWLTDNLYYDGAWKTKKASTWSLFQITNSALGFFSGASVGAGIAVTTSTAQLLSMGQAQSYDVDFFTVQRTRNTIWAKDTGTFGAVSLTSGSATLSGYIAWHRPAADGITPVRSGYMGWHATGIVLNLENSAAFTVQGGASIFANSITAQSTLAVTGLTTATGGVNLGDTTLNDYKIGPWTPGLTIAGGTATVSATRVGKYTRIGDQITAWFSLNLTAKTGTGAVKITGLPVAANASHIGGSQGTFYFTGIAGAGVGTIIGWVDQGATTFSLYFNPGTDTFYQQLLGGNLSATFGIAGTIVYYV